MPMEKPKLDPQLRIEENPRQVCCLEGDVETPSLCDLPVIELNEDEVPDKRTNEETQDEEDFNFGSLRADGSLLSLDDDMCVADEIFLNGQILPLRHSISSFDKLHINNNNNADTLVRVWSGSLQSLDRCGSMSSSGYRSSNYSTSRSSSTGSTGKSARNRFHSYPSPSPQIRACPGTRTVPTCGPKKPNSKSTLWDLLRRGLVRAPPELAPRRSTSYCHGQKIISRSSSSSSSSTVNDKGGGNGNGRVKKIPAPGDLSPAGAKKSVGGIFGGCKYSVEVVTNVGCGSAVVAEVEMMKGKTEEERRRVERRRRRRTFEWLKGVTDHGGVLNPV
ncbi:hypothetical protein Drorol1_Dr00009124 [Drosera rotundifolia]